MLDGLKQMSLTNRKVIENDSFIKEIDYNGSDGLVAIVTSKLQVLDAILLTSKREFALKRQTVDNAITGVRYVNRNTFVSSAADGYIRMWDDRVEDPVLALASSTRPEAEEELKPLLCCDVSLDGSTVAAGSEAIKGDAFVLFWDIRKSNKLMGGYWDSHSKDISQVKFHPRDKFHLATGGVDGLVNVFDLEQASEDEAVQYTLNVECAIEHLSWLTQSARKVDRLGVATTEEELQLWEAEEAEPFARFSGEALQRDDVEFSVDHIVSAHPIDSEACFITSANDGSADLWTTAGVHVASLGRCAEKKSSRHKDLVKSAVVCAVDGTLTLWTSGDDGIVCRWVSDSKPNGSSGISNRKAGSGLKAMAKSNRSRPY